MPDPIRLPHPIRSEQERENVADAVGAGWALGLRGEFWRSDLLPPVEPLPELPKPWALVGSDGAFQWFSSKDGAIREIAFADENWPSYAPHRVVRLAVVEVLDPEPEPPKAAPSGRKYKLDEDGRLRQLAPDGRWFRFVHVPLEDVEHVAALLREAEHGK